MSQEKYTQEIFRLGALKYSPINEIAIQRAVSNDVWRQGAAHAKAEPHDIFVLRKFFDNIKVEEQIQKWYDFENDLKHEKLS